MKGLGEKMQNLIRTCSARSICGLALMVLAGAGWVQEAGALEMREARPIDAQQALPTRLSENERTWRFDVSINDRIVGSHEFEITRTGEHERVDSRADFRFKVVFVTVFSYQHQSQEVWRENCLEQIDSNSRMNSDQFFVEGRKSGSTLVVTNQDGTQELASCVRSFAYWNPQILEARALLNAQTGRLEPVTISRLGPESFNVAGTKVPSVRYRIELEESEIEVWYSASQSTWLGLSTVTAEGQTIRYALKNIPEWDVNDDKKLSLAFTDVVDGSDGS